MAEGKPVVLRLDFPAALRLVVFVPAAPLRTRQARGVLPAKVPRADAVFNLGRAALWVAALGQGRFDLLPIATQDRLHQPYRFSLIPGSEQITLGGGTLCVAYSVWLIGKCGSFHVHIIACPDGIV